jgi:hypothetical protein
MPTILTRPVGSVLGSQKTPKQIITLTSARKKQKVWKKLALELRKDLDDELEKDRSPEKSVFLQQIQLASNVGHKEKSILMYLILARYRQLLQADTSRMKIGESKFFGWGGFKVLSPDLGKEVLEMFDGAEKTMNQFFRDKTGLMPAGGKWKNPNPWAVNSVWIKVESKQRRARKPPTRPSGMQVLKKQTFALISP